jgi:hypothetical protein
MAKEFQECHLYKSCLDDAIPKTIDNNMDLSPCKPLTKKNDPEYKEVSTYHSLRMLPLLVGALSLSLSWPVPSVSPSPGRCPPRDPSTGRCPQSLPLLAGALHDLPLLADTLSLSLSQCTPRALSNLAASELSPCSLRKLSPWAQVSLKRHESP